MILRRFYIIKLYPNTFRWRIAGTVFRP